jgi:hypothetical protein
MAPTLRHRQAALIARISPARAPHFCADSVPSRRDTRYAINSITLVQNIRQANLENLYLAAASFFPSICAVNLTLTIIVNALRVADVILRGLN